MVVTDRLVDRVARRAGGRDRLCVIVALGAVLALDSGDKGMIGATATELQVTFSVGTTGIGLLVTVTGVVATLSTIPFGVLVDRVPRVRLLTIVAVVWAVAMAVSAAAPTFGWLLCSRLALGASAAAAFPAVASLIGDWFPAVERARILGMVLAGELVGTGLGLLVGASAATLSWRLAFVLVGALSLAVAVLLSRLVEPARGGASQMTPSSATQSGDTDGPPPPRPTVESMDERRARDDHADPDEGATFHGDLARMPLRKVLSYVVRVRTNLILIVSSALGYYLFAGLRTFGLEFAGEHFGIGRGEALVVIGIGGIGGVVGVLAGGHISDRLAERGRRDARIIVPAAAFLAMTAAFAPAVIITSLVIAVPLLVLAAFFLAMANPPLDAARLDVIPAALWGRAESVRTVLRSGLEAVAPVAFGATAEHVFGGGASGLQATMLIMLVPLLVSPVVLLLARRTYPGDVASAAAIDQAA